MRRLSLRHRKTYVGLRAVFEDMADFPAEAQQFVEARWARRHHQSGQRRGAGEWAPVERVNFAVNEYREGRSLRVSIYGTKAEALKAVGLEE